MQTRPLYIPPHPSSIWLPHSLIQGESSQFAQPRLALRLWPHLILLSRSQGCNCQRPAGPRPQWELSSFRLCTCFASARKIPYPKTHKSVLFSTVGHVVHSTSSKTLSLAPNVHPPAIFCYTFFITFAAINESIDFENFVSKSSLRAVDLSFLPTSVLQAQKRAGISGFCKHVWWMSAMLSQAHLDTPRWLYLKILNICKYLFPNKVTSIDSGLQIYIWRRGAQVNPLQFFLCINNLF